MAVLGEIIRGFGSLLFYFAVGIIVALLIRTFFKFPQEAFRKVLHLICVGSIFVFLFAMENGYLAATCALLFGLLLYPFLAIGERLYRHYSNILVERNTGEIKRSLLVVFSMMAALMAIFWGWLDEKYMVLMAILAWGFGDAAAALVGKFYGRRPVHLLNVNGEKTWEGSTAMFMTAFGSILLSGLLTTPFPMSLLIVIAVIGGAVASAVELFTKGGWDTLTVPFAVASTIYLLAEFWIG